MSAKKNRYRDAKDKRPPGGFVALSNVVIRSDHFARLSPMAVKLLCDMLAQYDGNNNGDLCIAWTVMRKRAWRAHDSLHKAQRELESAGWIQRTRQGGRHVATLWALTIFALDTDNPIVKAKIDILPMDFNRGAWAQTHIDPPAGSVSGISCNPPAGSITAQLTRPLDQLP